MDAALALGLTDILFSDLVDGESNLPSLRSHLLAHAFLTAFPNSSGKDFARWAGADQTLSGTLLHGPDHQITVGDTVAVCPPIMGRMDALDAL